MTEREFIVSLIVGVLLAVFVISCSELASGSTSTVDHAVKYGDKLVACNHYSTR